MVCFRSASVPLPFCFRYAGKVEGHGIRVSVKSGTVKRSASVELPFRFRFASVMQAKLHVMTFLGLEILLGGHCATPPLSAEIGPGSQNEGSAPVCFRSASVPKGFLATSRFRVLGVSGLPPVRVSIPRATADLSATIPRPRLRVSNLLPFRFRSASVLLPLC